MPSEKYKRSSFRHAAKSFFGNFSAVSPYPFGKSLSLSPNTFTLLEDGDAASQADRRSAHNALERQRRENLNMKFQELAHALPSLQTVRRPSKTMIVAKSLEFVASSLSRESNYKNEITDLRKQNEKLRKQASCMPSTQTKCRSRPSTPLQTNSPTSSLPSPPLKQHYPQQEQPQPKQQRSPAKLAAHRLEHITYQDEHHEKKRTQKRYQIQQLQYQQQQQQQHEHEHEYEYEHQQQLEQLQQEQREKYTIAQESQQELVRDPFFPTTGVVYESWMPATAPAAMPERDYCPYDNDPSLMSSSMMYQRDPLLTTVPPPSYYYQPTTMNPVMMFASTVPGVAMPPVPSVEVYHPIVSGVPTSSPLS